MGARAAENSISRFAATFASGESDDAASDGLKARYALGVELGSFGVGSGVESVAWRELLPPRRIPMRAAAELVACSLDRLREMALNFPESGDAGAGEADADEAGAGECPVGGGDLPGIGELRGAGDVDTGGG